MNHVLVKKESVLLQSYTIVLRALAEKLGTLKAVQVCLVFKAIYIYIYILTYEVLYSFYNQEYCRVCMFYLS